MFTPTCRDDPICLIFFGWVGSTTNYLNHSQYVSADRVGLRTFEWDYEDLVILVETFIPIGSYKINVTGCIYLDIFYHTSKSSIDL